MLRGNRWQVVALLLAALVFAGALLTRPDPAVVLTPTPTPTPTQEVSSTVTPTTESAVVAPDVAPTEIEPDAPVVVALEPVAVSADGVATYREGLVGSVHRINPLLSGLNPVDADITSLVFEGLFSINAFGEPTPALARDWFASADGKQIVVRLRRDVFWQDGVPFTAADVAFTMAMLRSQDFPDRALRDFWRTVETEVVNDSVIRFRLTQPLGAFLEALRVGILPVHALEGTPVSELAAHPFNLSPVGTGPYQLEALRGEGGKITQVDLRLSPVYAARPEAEGRYAVQRVSFRLYDTVDQVMAALDAGELDGYAARDLSERAPLLDRSNSLLLRNGLEPTIGFVLLNWNSEGLDIFKEDRVRRALLIGANRRAAVERNMFNRAVFAEGALVPGGWAYAASASAPYDPSQAAFVLGQVNFDELIATPEPDSGATPEAEGVRARFRLLIPDDAVLLSLANALVTDWARLGFAVDIEALPVADLNVRLEAGQFEAAIVELSLWGTADPDVYAFWHDGQFPDGDNFGAVNDRLISELLERARSDFNGINRSNNYELFQTEFLSRAIAIPLYLPIYTVATTARVGNVQLGYLGTRADRFNGIGDWTLTD